MLYYKYNRTKVKGDGRLIEIYTDGACSGNPGPGGWGAVVVEDGNVIYAASERSPHTTNNQMEMSAILWALEYYGNLDLLPIVWSDSSYAVNTFNTWMWNWKENDWHRQGDLPIKNLDLVQRYDELIQQGHRIDLRKVKGHSGVRFNELADQLATGKISPEEVLEIGR